MDVSTITSMVETLLWSWHETKLFLEHSVAISSDALHLISSVVALLLAGFIVQKPVSSWWPWVTVFLATLLNEFIDLWVEQWPNPGMQYGEGAKDLLLTMTLPSLLLMTSRRYPKLYQPGGSISSRKKRKA